MAKWHRQDYTMIAKILREVELKGNNKAEHLASARVVNAIVNDFTLVFQRDNQSFDSRRFRDACIPA